MISKKMVALAAGLSLMSASTAQALPAPAPAPETVEGAELRAPYFLIGGIITVVLLVLLFTVVLDNDTNAVPLSP